MTNEFLRFLVTGGTSAMLNLASRWLLSHVVRFEIAVAVAYLIGMITAYGLARLFVFQPSGRGWARELLRFTAVNVVSGSLVWLISVGLARLLFPNIGFTWHSEDVAHAIGLLAPAVLSYFGHRMYTFAGKA
ncbi:MAG: GtrA family protein [Ancalomicrobiaceae bacterium]|nr:GtrA family protein [Ancalomicrobiaceae bacterium]